MDFIIKEVMKNFEDISKQLNAKSLRKIYEQFPVPREQKILWVDNIEKNKIYGMVITDTGIFF